MGNCWEIPGIPALETICCETDNNALTYILTTLKLDATQHCWVESLAGFTFSIEYQKGRDNVVADALSCVASKLNTEAVKSILDGVTVGTVGRADVYNPAETKAGERIHKQVEETVVWTWAACMCINLLVMEWVAVQQEDPILKIVME